MKHIKTLKIVDSIINLHYGCNVETKDGNEIFFSLEEMDHIREGMENFKKVTGWRSQKK